MVTAIAACASTAPEPAEEQTPPSYEDDEKADAAYESRLVGTKNQWGEIIRPDEAAAFAGFAQKMNELQRTLAMNGTPKRGFHAKVHGCMKAEFRPDANRPAVTRAGVFATDNVKQAWIRMSSGQGRSLEDNERDVRGLAIKMMDVAGERLLGDDATTQDFLMTTRPSSHVNDATEFMDFADSAANNKLIAWALFHPVAAARLFRGTAPITSLTTKFWSGSPYRVGQSVAKFSVWPCNGTPPGTQGSTTEDPNYLRIDLETRLASNDLCYQFGVQLRREPSNESVEKASSVWDENRNPFIPVGQLVIAKRTATRADEEYCDDLAFNPWNGVVEHQPLGHMNRSRRAVYSSSAQFRGHAPEPRAD